MHEWNYLAIDSIEIDDKLYDKMCREDPEALGEIATLLKTRGHHGWRELKKSGGYRKLKRVGCVFEI